MNTPATLSRLFAGIQSDLDQVDATFQERATSGLTILNSASMYALGSQGKRLRTAITLLSAKLNKYCFEKLIFNNFKHFYFLNISDYRDNSQTTLQRQWSVY